MRILVTFIAALTVFSACTNTEPMPPHPTVENEVSYTAGETTMNGFIAYSENFDGDRPGILVVHEWWGHDEHARNSARKLAEMGYVALAVDMYGDGKQAAHPEDAMNFSSEVMGNMELATARFEAALELLKESPNVNPDKIGAIGYCFGGSVILTMANAGVDLDAVAGFHAGLQLPVMPDSGNLTARVLVMNGAADPFITDEQVENFVGALESVNADYNYISYENAVHAFTNPGADTLGAKFDLPLAYDAEADSASWSEMTMFFEETFAEGTESEM